MNEIHPRCNHAPGCCARKAGKCLILKNTNFGDKPCPFRKTAEQNAAENNRIMERLLAEERYDLLDKYYGGVPNGRKHA